MKKTVLVFIGMVFLVGLMAGGICMAQQWEYEGVININTASVQTLHSLLGIDMETAQNIVSFRQVNGPFSTLDEIKMVNGVTPELMNQISAHCVIDEETKLDYRQ